jgi:hypothetical protein
MSRNNSYQQIDSSVPSSAKNLLRTQQKNIVCDDCGGISTAKVQQLLSTLEGTTQLFNTTPSIKNRPKRKNSARNNSQKNSVNRRSKKKISRNDKRQLSINKIRSARNPKNKIKSKSKNNNATRVKKLSKRL